MSYNDYRKCSKCGANRINNPSLRFHRFPLLAKDEYNLDQLRSWAVFSFPDKDWSSIEDLATLHKANKNLCGRHFCDSAYTANDRKKLGKFAIPVDECHINKAVPMVPGPSCSIVNKSILTEHNYFSEKSLIDQRNTSKDPVPEHSEEQSNQHPQKDQDGNVVIGASVVIEDSDADSIQDETGNTDSVGASAVTEQNYGDSTQNETAENTSDIQTEEAIPSISNKQCVSCNAWSNDGNENINMTTFPSNPARCKKWVQALGIEELAHKSVEELSTRTYLCYEHFRSRQLIWVCDGAKVSKNAVPNMNINRVPLDKSLLNLASNDFGDESDESLIDDFQSYEDKTPEGRNKKGLKLESKITEDPIVSDTARTNKIYDEFLLVQLTEAVQRTIYCSLCLSTNEGCLSLLDDTDHYALWRKETDLSFMQILIQVFGHEIVNSLSSRYICQECSNSAIEAFTFIYKTKTSHQVLNQYIQDIELTLDAVEGTCKDLECIKETAEDVTILPQTQRIINNVKKCITKKERFALKRSITESYRIADNKYFICPECGECKKSIISFINHLQLHGYVYNEIKCASCRKVHMKGGKCKYTCYDCDKAHCIHDKYIVEFVNQLEIGAKSVKCPDCDFIATKRRHMISHANKTHLDNYSVLCEGCSQTFYSKSSLKCHIAKYHTLKHACEYCNKVFKLKSTRDEHERKCEKIRRQFSCTVCKYSSDTLMELRRHNIRKHSGGHKCFVCNFKALSEKTLLSHMRMTHSGRALQKRCNICNEMIARGKMQEHMNTVHPKPQDELEAGRRRRVLSTCKHCRAVFTSKKERDEHSKSHYSVTCQKCETQVLKGKYREHLRYHQIEEARESFPCDKCDKEFTTLHLLKLHQATHYDPIQCYICNKKVSYCSFKSHMLRHRAKTDLSAKEKLKFRSRIKCPKCDHTSYTKGHLEAHVNNIHNNCKPYTCDICPRKFAAQYLLDNHLEQHLGTRFECFVCRQKFADRSSYVRHSREHHGDVYYDCPTCRERFNDAKSLTFHRNIMHSRGSTMANCENQNVKAQEDDLVNAVASISQME